MALLARTILIAITLLAAVPSSLADAYLISKACRGVIGIPNCVEVLSSDPRSVNATTWVELQSISLDICTATSRKGDKTIEEEKAKQERDRDEKLGQALNMCSSQYSEADYTLGKARTDFGNRAYDKAAEKIVGAISAAENCEKAFYDLGVKNVMKQMNKKMMDWCEVSSQLIF